MFTEARIRLTVWYVVGIMVLSTLFSIVVYQGLVSELDRGLRVQALRVVPKNELRWKFQASPLAEYPYGVGFPLPISPIQVPFDPDLVAEVKSRLVLQLGILNLAILTLSSIGAYLLAGKSLQPIERMMDQQKRFISDASHELRTPLTAMRTQIEVALLDKKLSTGETKEILESNLEEIDKMKELSDYLLSLSRLEAQATKLPMTKVNMSTVIDQAVRQLNHKSTEKKIKIKEDIDELFVKGNKVSLIELVTILLDNAVKYSHEHGQIDVRLLPKKGMVLLEIQDHGIGIKASELPYIFNRFYRADSSRTKNKIEGFGLGLAIAKNIVDLHKGQIYVYSEIGKGSLFQVFLHSS